VQLPITGRLTREMHADLCLVAVRREQINEVLPDLMTALGRARVVLAAVATLPPVCRVR
jgi:hypothetical protein